MAGYNLEFVRRFPKNLNTLSINKGNTRTTSQLALVNLNIFIYFYSVKSIPESYKFMVPQNI
jgi:hypothetical protein